MRENNRDKAPKVRHHVNIDPDAALIFVLGAGFMVMLVWMLIDMMP